MQRSTVFISSTEQLVQLSTATALWLCEED